MSFKHSRPDISSMIKNIQENPNDVHDLCKNLHDYFTRSDVKNIKRPLQYDAYFLGSIATIYGVNEPIYFGSKLINNTTFDPNNEFQVKSKMNFFLEDIYTICADELYLECDELNRTGQTYLFRSNLVNIALMLMCFSTQCFDNYFKSHQNKKHAIDTQKIYQGYLSSVNGLVDAVINAYIDCKYVSLKTVYKLYLDFYQKYMLKSLNMFEFHQPGDLNNILDGSGYFVYLSCNLQPEYLMGRLVPTKFAVSHIGFRPAHEELYDTIYVISHDMEFHGVIERIPASNEEYTQQWRNYILDLYNYNEGILFKIGSRILWESQNEIYKNEPFFFKNFIATLLGDGSSNSVFNIFKKDYYKENTYTLNKQAIDQSEIKIEDWYMLIHFLVKMFSHMLSGRQLKLCILFIENPNLPFYKI